MNELPGEGQPDLVIGVDFGMTQTGVAYCSAPWSHPKSFQHWAGNVNEIANKVPSRVAYDIQTGKLKSWGFGCDLQDPSLDVVEHFKLYLDPDYRDDYADITPEDAQKYFLDFLSEVHQHVASYFRVRIPNWNSVRAEWVFSVPTTWKDAAFIHSLEHLIRRAGFGADGASHSCRITLTEAEAAGISVACQYLEQDDIILVCDAGGGTTDVNILKLVSPKGQPVKLDPLLKTEGRPIGSALIDIRIQQYLERYLKNIAHRLDHSPAEVAEQMMIGRFERFKCNFGAPGSNLPYLLLDVPGLPPEVYMPQANVVNSQIRITSEILKNVFDEQVDALVALVHEQIRSLQFRNRGERVNYIILSGGLGSSPYVQDRLTSHFNKQVSLTTPAAAGLKILAAEEPQLSVVHGLVLERAQQISQGLTPITSRCARVSYGVVVRQKYNPKIHKGQPYIRDDRDGKRWALDQIEWLIKEGERLRPEGVIKRYRAKIDSSQLRQPWHTHFVMSMEPASRLPSSLSQHGVRTLCLVEADVSQTKRIVKNGHWWNFARRYELTLIDVKVLPGSADLKLEVWNDGRRLNSDNYEVEVKWENKLGNPTMVAYSPQPDTTIKINGVGGYQPRPNLAAGEYERQREGMRSPPSF
ncbi:uncharacterized protein Z518_10379 [Rhinocladiella mackenziei CBS 650.93]|uniref:Rhinocladiella mackenziei CBS 650.93 unplaced genomic scaffold supercont1.9, whole genome shotgun sequence n=1 Tax=Rhinocladiella mackenziei CBS 650.93 TaxID=1442369 RepID=A0A0D2IU17_9EURO|nr:uncharacterized protein Z518_10379 [Rhinocladiella mackenziei CBS 650.93]KIX00240.1 hypothetical protein Z518_10379 [Rhinocladiella mackenziei CBS 650.93]